MRVRVIGDLVAHAGLEHDDPAVLELRVDLAFEAQHDVPLRAPVVGDVAGRVLDHADADLAELLRAPEGDADWRRQQQADFQADMKKAGASNVETRLIAGRDHSSIWGRMKNANDETAAAIIAFIKAH